MSEIEIRHETEQEVIYTVTPVVAADPWSEDGKQEADEAWDAALRALSLRWKTDAEKRRGSEDRYGGELMEQCRQEIEAILQEMGE